MITFRFNPYGNLITLEVELKYRARHTIKMALDTASSISTIRPDVATRLGFDLGTVLNMETVSTANQIISVPLLVIPSVTLYTETVHDLEVLCVPLPSQTGVRGTLGLNFLRHFKVTLDFGEGLASFERIALSSEA
mgnify:CR=1 FL=1